MKNFLIIFSVLFFISCDSDDESNPNTETSSSIPNSSSVIFNSYQKTQLHSELEEIGNSKTIKSGDLVQEKFTDFQFQVYFENELMSDSTYNEFEYIDNKLMSFYPIEEADFGTKQELFYDIEGDFSGFFWEKANRYYRVVHSENNIDFFEVMRGDFSDENSTITRRYILKFDDRDNVILAGQDYDFDGIMDVENSFVYDENDNLIQIELHNGETANFDYSNVKNTESYILDNSYNRRIRRLKCSEVYGYPISIENITKLEHSKYLTDSEVSSAITLEVQENGFYTKYEKVLFENVTETLEFFTE